MKNAQATTRLVAALRAYPEALRYLRTHQPKYLRRLARYLAAYPGHLSACVARCCQVTAEALPTITYRQDDYAYDQERQARYADTISRLIDPAYQQTLPATIHGCGPRERGYWFEPTTAPVADRATYDFTVEDQACMEPRFLPKQQIRVQRIHAKKELVPGRVYVRESYGSLQLVRVTNVQQGWVETVRDRTGRTGRYALHGTFDRRYSGLLCEDKWYRFVEYVGGYQLLPIANEYQARKAAAMEGQSTPQPAVAFVPKRYGRAARRQALQAA